MPKVKSERGKEGEKPYDDTGKSRKGGWGWKKAEGEDSNHNNDGEAAAVQGAGFKDKEKAEETLRILDGRDTCYQFYVVNSMFHRAKLCIKRTKDEEKIHKMEDAMAVFEAWLDDYRAHNRSKENCAYLPMEIIEGYLPLAKHYGLSNEYSSDITFLSAYRKVDGDMKKLRTTPVDEKKKEEGSGPALTWDIERNRKLKEKLSEIRENHLPLFETDLGLKGLPTRDHMQLVLLAYSPDVTKMKKAMPLMKEKLGVPNGDDSKDKQPSSSSEEDSS